MHLNIGNVMYITFNLGGCFVVAIGVKLFWMGYSTLYGMHKTGLLLKIIGIVLMPFLVYVFVRVVGSNLL